MTRAPRTRWWVRLPDVMREIDESELTCSSWRRTEGRHVPPLREVYRPAVSASCASVIVCIANPKALLTSVRI